MAKIINVPVHIGVIMDGNGRWAKKRRLPRSKGHQAGIDAVRNTIYSSLDYGVKCLSFYAFSTENWKREKQEIDAIFDLLEDYLEKDKTELNEKNIKIRTMGDLTKLPKKLVAKLEEVIELTKNNDGLTVNLGLNYGGTCEIVRACNLAFKNSKKDEISEKDFEKYLYTYKMPNPDFIIRTSGEMRLSNFMLYQAAYSEFYFPKTYFPDFDKKEFKKALLEFSKRKRRFGGY